MNKKFWQKQTKPGRIAGLGFANFQKQFELKKKKFIFAGRG